MAVVLSVAAALPAGAATVERELVGATGYRDSDESFYSVLFRAAEGESNRVTVTRDGEAIVVTDAGASLAAGDGCRAVTRSTARCAGDSRYRVTSVRLDVGDGDDRVDAQADGDVSALGGPGDDVLASRGRSSAWLDGGDGRDLLTVDGDGLGTLTGGPGDDTLRGGAGGDQLVGDGRGASPGDDLIDGGAGVDRVLYSERTEPVAVDLAVGSGGQTGETDLIARVENLAGGTGPDALAGDDGPNTIEGGDSRTRLGKRGDDIDGRGGNDGLHGTMGADRLSGGTGDDGLEGVRGHDIYDAGAGSDRLSLSQRHAARRVRCGNGSDTVFSPHSRDVLRPDCETAWVDDILALRVRRARSRRSALIVRAVGGDAGSYPPCRSIVTVRRGRRLVGRVVLRRISARPKTVAVRTTRYGNRLLARPGQAKLRVRSVSLVDCRGRRSVFRPLRGGYTARL